MKTKLRRLHFPANELFSSSYSCIWNRMLQLRVSAWRGRPLQSMQGLLVLRMKGRGGQHPDPRRWKSNWTCKLGPLCSFHRKAGSPGWHNESTRIRGPLPPYGFAGKILVLSGIQTSWATWDYCRSSARCKEEACGNSHRMRKAEGLFCETKSHFSQALRPLVLEADKACKRANWRDCLYVRWETSQPRSEQIAGNCISCYEQTLENYLSSCFALHQKSRKPTKYHVPLLVRYHGFKNTQTPSLTLQWEASLGKQRSMTRGNICKSVISLAAWAFKFNGL